MKRSRTSHSIIDTKSAVKEEGKAEDGGGRQASVAVKRVSQPLPQRSKEGSSSEGGASFTGVCSLCNKPIGLDEVYMYGDFGAFCSSSCRFVKMHIDNNKH